MAVRADLVGGILPVRSDGRFLLLQRRGARTWEPPAGRLAPGEGFAEGAVREVYEETGLLVAPETILATWVGSSPLTSALASVTYTGRVVDDGGGPRVRLSREHLAYRWVTPEEWLELPSWWSKEDIRRAADHLAALPGEAPMPEAPPRPRRPRRGVVNAILGSGVVLVDLGGRGSEPHALLMRRRKPPVGLWENPGGTLLEPGEDFVACARREALEETGLEVEPRAAWWTRVESWKAPDDPELYAGVGFVAPVPPGAEVRLESAAHDAYTWATESEWRELPTWYTREDSDALWAAVRNLA